MPLSRHLSRLTRRLAALAPAVLLLAGCAAQRQSSDGFFGVITPYRMDIVQGNVVTQEQVAQLKTGMTRLQVRDLLGSPLLTDIFHADRWDYLFTIRRQGTEPQRRSVKLFFQGETLERMEVPDLPSENEFVASITRSRGTPKVPQLELTEEQRAALPVPPKPAEPPAEAVGPLREYPPLEAPR